MSIFKSLKLAEQEKGKSDPFRSAKIRLIQNLETQLKLEIQIQISIWFQIWVQIQIRIYVFVLGFDAPSTQSFHTSKRKLCAPTCSKHGPHLTFSGAKQCRMRDQMANKEPRP